MSAISNAEAVSPAALLVVEEKKEVSQPSVQEQSAPSQAVSRNPETLQKAAAEITLNPSIQEIIARADKLVESSDKKAAKVLYDFYSKEINQLDSEFLKKNPELIFRRVLAGMQRETGKKNAIKKYLELCSEARDDFKFVAEHAEKGSRLSEVATKRLGLIEEMLRCQSLGKKDFFKKLQKLTDDCLRSWLANHESVNSEMKGGKLREKVFYALLPSAELKLSFIDEITKIFESEPEVVLGKAESSEVKILLNYGRKDKLTLIVQAKFNWAHNSLFVSRKI